MSASPLLIHGARDISGAPTDLLIDAGRIAAVGADLSAPAGAELLDASGLTVLPGAIDPHVHFNEPGRTDWEGWATGSAAAAAGGTTTVADMPLNSTPPTVDVAGFELKAAAAAASSRVDFCLWGGVIPGNRGELAGLAERGVIGFKAFMSGSGISDFPAVDDLTLYEAMGVISELGLPLALHAESDALTSSLAERARLDGRTAVRDYLRSRPPIAETEAIARALELASTSGCPLHIVHVSTARGARLVAEARGRGQDVTCEFTAHHLVLTEHDAELLGAVAKCAPPLRSPEEVDALWPVLEADRSTFVVSDHSPAPAELQRGEDAFAVWGGIAGVQSTVELVLTEGVRRGRLTPARAPEVLARAAAERFRLPNKGWLEQGRDADVVLVGLDGDRELERDSLLDRHRLSPYVGRTLGAEVRHTLRRGELIYDRGRAGPGAGGRLIRPER